METLLVAATLDNVVNELVQNDGSQLAQNQIIPVQGRNCGEPTSSNPCLGSEKDTPKQYTRVHRAWTCSDDKIVWQAWLATGRYKYDPSAPSHLELAQQLKRTPYLLYERMVHLQQLVKRANRLLKHSRVNLVTGKSAHRIWHAYLEQKVYRHHEYAWWPNIRAVTKTSVKYGWDRVALFRTLESICLLKRVSDIYCLHD